MDRACIRCVRCSTATGLYAFIEPGPKRHDLLRDGRYALHCYPPNDNEDAFYIAGVAQLVQDDALRDAVRATFWKERGRDEAPEQAEAPVLFEFFIERCLLTRTSGHGDWNPQHTIWAAT